MLLVILAHRAHAEVAQKLLWVEHTLHAMAPDQGHEAAFAQSWLLPIWPPDSLARGDVPETTPDEPGSRAGARDACAGHGSPRRILLPVRPQAARRAGDRRVVSSGRSQTTSVFGS